MHQQFKEKLKNIRNNPLEESLKNNIKKSHSASMVHLAIKTKANLVVFINASTKDLTFNREIPSSEIITGKLPVGCALIRPGDGKTVFNYVRYYDSYEIEGGAKLYVVMRDNPL